MRQKKGTVAADKVYNFDHVFNQHATQEDVFGVAINPIVEEVLTGFNCTVFACTCRKKYTVVLVCCLLPSRLLMFFSALPRNIISFLTFFIFLCKRTQMVRRARARRTRWKAPCPRTRTRRTRV